MKHLRFAVLFSVLWLNPLSLWDEWAKSGAYLLQYLYGYAEAQAQTCQWTGAGGLSLLGTSPRVLLAGHTSGVADANAEFRVHLSQGLSGPSPAYCSVKLKLDDQGIPGQTSAWQAGFRLATMQPFHPCEWDNELGEWLGYVDSTRTVTVKLDANGYGYFRLVGWWETGGDSSVAAYATYWFKNNPNIGYSRILSQKVATYDLNGAGGVTVADLAVFSQDKNASDYRQRSDYNGDNAITVADLALFGVVKNGGGSTESGNRTDTPCGEGGGGGAPASGRAVTWGSVKVSYR